MKNKLLVKLIAVLLIVLLRVSVAGAAGFSLFAENIPAEGIKPGDIFAVQVKVTPYEESLAPGIGTYRITLGYNPLFAVPLYAENANESSAYGFTRPITHDSLLPGNLILEEYHLDGQCIPTGMYIHIANVYFIAQKAAIIGTNQITVASVNYVEDCAGFVTTPEYFENMPVEITFGGQGDFTTTGFDQFLDLDGDNTFTDLDTQAVCAIAAETVANTGDMSINAGGLQADVNGNGIIDIYDCGLSRVYTSPIEFLNTGSTGIAETCAMGDDIQKIMPGMGKPFSTAITGGPNATLDTAPSTVSDDIVQGDVLTTGGDGICNTTAQGDDVQVIPVDQGKPYSVMIKPGPNRIMDTMVPYGGDDELYTFSKELIIEDLLGTYSPPGKPAQLVKAFPLSDPIYVPESASQGTIPQVLLGVKILDDDGTPMVGISPCWNVVQGGSFNTAVGGAQTVCNLPTDSIYNTGAYPTGTSYIVFNPSAGGNIVEAYLTADASKGLNEVPPPVTFNIQGLSVLPAFPDTVMVDIFEDPDLLIPTSTVNVGDTAYLKIHASNSSYGGVPGLEDQITLTSSRNASIVGIENDEYGYEPATLVFNDGFETSCPTDGDSSWVIENGDPVAASAYIFCDDVIKGYFGQKSLRISGGYSEPIVISRTINLNTYKNINLLYQWGFSGNPYGESSYGVQYSTDGGTTWNIIQSAISAIDLNCPTGLCLADDGYLQLYRSNLYADVNANYNGSFKIKFSFNPESGSEFYLDNVAMGGMHVIYSEDFESQADGMPPAGFDSADRVITGKNGICETAAQGDDIQRIPLMQGEQYSECVAAGLNRVLDTVAAGDDYISGSTIYTDDGTGDGICESTAVSDDFQVIEPGNGKGYAVAVESGSNQYLETTPSGDDQLQSKMGPDPLVVVDMTIGGDSDPGQGNNGSDKFVKISRASAGPNPKSYYLRKIFNLDGYDNVWLTVSTRSLGLANINSSEPGQKWLCEVSDNGGESFIPVWDSSASVIDEGVWKKRKVCLSCDPRLQIVDEIIVQWRAAMDNTEEGGAGDPDAAYIDDIILVGTPKPPDVFGHITDLGGGEYSATINSVKDGLTEIVAIVKYETIPPVPAFNYPGKQLTFNAVKVDPNSVRVVPETFTVKSCETLDFYVYGRYEGAGPNEYEDMTNLFTFTVNGPARISSDGHLVADCSLNGDPKPIQVNAVPIVSGLYDPGGEGENQQTGYIEGRVSESLMPFAEIEGASVRIESDSKFSDTSDTDGLYFRSGVPIGTYNVKALLNGYVLDEDTGISVTAGNTATANLLLDNGSDTDGDTVADSIDTDDDGDGVPDTSEASTSCQYDPDCDDDDVDDKLDWAPTDPNEWADSDGDTIGDNTDTDDDDDTISDWEEENIGTDGYITDPLSPDTDSDGLDDDEEIDGDYGYYTDPTDEDTDGGGRNDGDEIDMSRDPTNASDDNSVPTAVADADYYLILNQTSYLYGYDSGDADDDTIYYEWELASGPSSTAITFDTDDESVASFSSTYSGTYTFRLKVSDFIAQGVSDLVAVDIGSDSDGDGLSDNFEINVSGSSVSNGDGDGDGLTDIHEYYNTTTAPDVEDETCAPGLACFLDGTGDFLIMADDLPNLKSVVYSFGFSYDGLYPAHYSLLDNTGDGFTMADDIPPYSGIVMGTSSITGGPTGIVTVPLSFGTPEIAIGETVTVTVEVTSADQPRSGVGVVFSVTGPGELLGGRGNAKQYDPSLPEGSRWDVTPALSGGHSYAAMTVRRTGSGTITVNAFVPYYGAYEKKGLSSTLEIDNPITILEP